MFCVMKFCPISYTFETTILKAKFVGCDRLQQYQYSVFCSRIKSSPASRRPASDRRRRPAAASRNRDVPTACDGQRGHAGRFPRAPGRTRAGEPARCRTQLRHGEIRTFKVKEKTLRCLSSTLNIFTPRTGFLFKYKLHATV